MIDPGDVDSEQILLNPEWDTPKSTVAMRVNKEILVVLRYPAIV